LFKGVLPSLAAHICHTMAEQGDPAEPQEQDKEQEDPAEPQEQIEIGDMAGQEDAPELQMQMDGEQDDLAHLLADGNLELLAAAEDQLDDGLALEQGDVEEEEALPADLGIKDDEDEDGGLDQDNKDDEHEVHEHLKDAVEGSLRIKRLLSMEDEEEEPGKKKRKLDDGLGPGVAEQAKIQYLLTKWNLQSDAIVKHVLEDLPLKELEDLANSGYVPDKFNAMKSAAELLARHAAECRERKTLPGGGPLDAISTFKFRWKLDADTEKVLRGLSHAHLRHVLTEYNGTVPLQDLIADAESVELDEDLTENALPDAPGMQTYSRFGRLELIDPLADCAVFGDANLTFAVKLARHRKALGHVGRVIATTFEELDTLRERYKEIDASIQVLEEHFAEVFHGVDCTRIALDSRFEGLEGTLGAVYYNYPHSGAIQGFFDGHPLVNWRHENLMRLFFRALRSFVKPGGIVKVSSNMGAVGVRYSFIVGSAIENEFVHCETMPFLEWHLHRYGRSYGDRRDAYKRPDASNNQSYNAQRAEADMVYCFQYKPSGKQLPKQKVRNPPTLKTLSACMDGPFKNLQGPTKAKLSKQLHKRFVTECSGVHVG